jgi:hydrogenase maturation protease
MFAEQLQALVEAAPSGRVEVLTDYQLQVEHALDLVGRQRVLFVDASLAAAAPFEASVLQPAADASVTTHALSPAALMQVFRQLHGSEPPPCTLLAIRGAGFDLGAAPSAAALSNLELALAWGQRWLAAPTDASAAADLRRAR